MADVRDCDVENNGEVFEDVVVDSDPNNILHNVEQACTKILIPSMAHSSMSKLSSSEQEETTDVMFPALKNDDVDDDSNSSGTKYVVQVESLKREPSVSNSIQRSVKWSLDCMAEAMDSVLGGELTTTQAAKKFGIPRTTLLDRLSMKVKGQHLDSPGSFPLSAENDSRIVEFVLTNVNLKKPLLIKGMMALAEELAIKQGRPFDSPLNTRKWLKLFVCKHPKLDIMQYSRRRSSISQQSSLHQHHPSNNIGGGSVVTSLIRSTASNISSSGGGRQIVETPMVRIQHIGHPTESNQTQQVAASLNEIEIKMPDDITASLQQHPEEQPSPSDNFESNLAKQALEAIEQKLTPEQHSYFHYRFFNNSLDRGYELWRHCRTKLDNADNENFESVLSSQALIGIQQALVAEHLKYFQFRYENPDLEEGFKLWLMMKKKCSKL